jgi:hypothetical protein
VETVFDDFTCILDGHTPHRVSDNAEDVLEQGLVLTSGVAASGLLGGIQ